MATPRFLLSWIRRPLDGGLPFDFTALDIRKPELKAMGGNWKTR